MRNGSLIGTKVIVGRDYYIGHKDRFRSGEVVTDPIALGPSAFAVDVLCQPRGRERKPRVITECLHSLLRDTPECRQQLLAQGYDPDKPFACAGAQP